MRPRKSLTWFIRGVGTLATLATLSALSLLSGCGSTEDNRPLGWTYIYPSIIEPSCATASCHSAFADKAGVNLSNIDVAYEQIVDRHFAVPNHPADSGLLNLLNAQGVRRMPPDFALPRADIQLISDWIAAGAKFNEGDL